MSLDPGDVLVPLPSAVEWDALERRLEVVTEVAADVHLTLHPGPFRFCSDPVCYALHRAL